MTTHKFADSQRMWDLLRYQRQDLHQQELITNEEYALLAEDHPAVKRLESYDEVLDRMTKALAAAQADTEALREVLVEAAIPLEALRMNIGATSIGLCPELEQQIMQATDRIRESLAGRKS